MKMTHFDKEEARIFDILTSRIRYNPRYLTEDDLDPDLVIKIAVPNARLIPRADYL
jgi:hypothetical protein